MVSVVGVFVACCHRFLCCGCMPHTGLAPLHATVERAGLPSVEMDQVKGLVCRGWCVGFFLIQARLSWTGRPRGGTFCAASRRSRRLATPCTKLKKPAEKPLAPPGMPQTRLWKPRVDRQVRKLRRPGKQRIGRDGAICRCCSGNNRGHLAVQMLEPCEWTCPQGQGKLALRSGRQPPSSRVGRHRRPVPVRQAWRRVQTPATPGPPVPAP